MTRTDDIKIFVAVVLAGGFSASADQLGLTRSAICRRIDMLETRLGVRLLTRTTRRIKLTEAGQVFYEHCSQIDEDISRAEKAVLENFGAPRGTLRINSAVMIGIRMVIPLLGGFTRAYPELRVIIDLSDVPFPKDDTSYDVFIRLGDVADDRLNASRIAESRRVICAAPSYIRRAGEPACPQDLSSHDCLLLSGLGAEHNEWAFDGPDGRETVRVQGSLVFTSGDGHYEALLAGHGIGRVTELFAGPDLAGGRLIRMLEPYQSKKVEPIHALYRGGRHIPLKVRAFLDYLKHFSANADISLQMIGQGISQADAVPIVPIDSPALKGDDRAQCQSSN